MKKISLIIIALILAFTEISYGAPAAGDIMFRDANLNWVSLPIGAEGNALIVSSSLPAWGSGGLSGTAASYLSYYGADPTGVGDSTTAVNNWLAYLAANGEMGVCEPGTYKFTSALTAVTGSNWGFTSPGGPATCRLIYAGAATDVDLMTLGDGSNDYTAVYINGLRIDSLTTMTAGAALHIKRIHRSRFDNVWAAGQDGSSNLWNGVYFDVIDTDYYTGINNKVQNDAIMVEGAAAGQAGLWLNTGRILSSACGIKVGGGFGGLYVDNMDIIVNTYNVIIDNSLAAAANREIFFGPNTMLDSAGVTNLHINDTVAATGTIIFDGWNCSSAGKGIDINSWPSGNVQISAGRHFNNGSDAIYIGDNTTNVLIGSGVSIDLNTGWGVNGVSTTLLRSWANVKNNTAGNYHANVANQHVLDGNLYMENEDHVYMKDGDGNYSSALTTMFGAGASVLMVGGGFDATFVMNELYMYNNKNFYMQDGDGNNSSALVAYPGVGASILMAAGGFDAFFVVPDLYMYNNKAIYMQDGDGNNSNAMAAYPGAGISLLLLGAGFTNIGLQTDTYMPNSKAIYMKDGDDTDRSALVAKSGVGVNVLTLGSGFASVEVPSLTASLPVFTDSDKYLVSVANQTAINTLTAVSGATNEHVLTKDTTTGNAIFKAAAGATAAGADTQIQYNSSGVFGAGAGLTYSGDQLSVIGQTAGAISSVWSKAATDAAMFLIRSNSTDRAKWISASTGTYFDYTGTLTFRTIAGTTTASIEADGDMYLAKDMDVSGALTLGTALAIAEGGTGETSIAAGSVWAANAANNLSAITSTSGTKYLKNTTGTITWEDTIEVAQGGTGATTAAAAASALGVGTEDTPTFDGLNLTDPLVMDNNTSINAKNTTGSAKSLAILNDSNYIFYGYLAPSRVYLAGGATASDPIYMHLNGSDYNVTISAAECGGTGKRCLIITP